MSTMTKNEKNQAVISFEISKETMDKAMDAAFQKNRGRYAIPGFRKGKAPRRIIEQYYGAGVFFEDAFNDAFPAAYEAAVVEHQLEPVGRPEVELEDVLDDGTVKVKATVTLMPEVKLGKYEGIKVDLVEYNVTDEEVDHEIQHALDRASRFVDVEDRTVQVGDTVGLNYSGSVDGVKFDGGTAENQTLEIGSGSFIPGFEEQMVGMAIGEEKALNVKFPDEYHAEELKGKEAVFEVKVLSIKEKQVPALDDEFAKDVSEFDTLDEYKADIKAKLEERKKNQANTEMENKMVEAIAENAEVEIPDCMVEQQIDSQLRDMEMRMSYQGLKLDDYLKYTGMTMSQMRDMYREGAKKTVKIRLTLSAIIKAENIDATEEEIKAEIEKYAANYGAGAEEFAKSITDDQKEYFKEMVIMNKTIEMLKEKNPAKKKRNCAKKTAAADDACEEKPAAKKTAKKAAAKEDACEEKPAAKKSCAKKTTAKADGEKKPAAKKTAKKVEE
ncbi:MAG: trigger factor [Clostridia bacterium]|nr:trigger factor [Clostridia bacterium]